ncbi:hypothetical protein [Crocinitomix catalasitica]|uniref:hypothetical protein n=1 Tax=Crocinitomix catalasitica TaxID=184607 RepID=UPI000482B8D7|nr:hypothetical protein [Crocinitomix catalasitica]
MSTSVTKDFTHIDYQIDLNEKRLDFYNTSYQKTQAKFTLIMVFYSVFAVYIAQLFFFIGDCINGKISEFVILFYVASLVVFLFFLSRSIYHTARFLIPIEIAYMELPEVFYKDCFADYKKNGVKKEDLNGKIKSSYLLQQEESLRHNRKAFENKSVLFYSALINAVFALIPFIISVSFYIGNEDDVQKIKIENVEQITQNYEQQKQK